LNGVQVSDTATDCAPIEMAPGVLVTANCYGLERKDIFYQYPMFNMDAKDSGYFFAVDTDYWLISGQLHLGLNIVTVMARTKDPLRPAVVIDQIPVIVDCPTDGIFPAIGELEHPIAMEPMSGTYLVQGWVFEFPNSVKRLNFWVDGVLDGSLIAPNANINMVRDDVVDDYPWLPYPVSRYSGFKYSLDTTKYVDGVHQLVIEAITYNGYDNFWVQRPMVFDNLNRP